MTRYPALEGLYLCVFINVSFSIMLIILLDQLTSKHGFNLTSTLPRREGGALLNVSELFTVCSRSVTGILAGSCQQGPGLVVVFTTPTRDWMESHQTRLPQASEQPAMAQVSVFLGGK